MATGEQHCDELAEIFCDIVKCGLENHDDLGVHRSNYLAELSPGARDVMELALQERVPFFERRVLLEGERVDGAHEADLALQLARTGRGAGTGRQWRAFGTLERLGLAIEFPAYRLGERLEAPLHLCLLQLVAGDLFSDRRELSFHARAFAAQRLEVVRSKSQGLGLRLAHLAQSAEGDLQGRQPGADNEAEPGDRTGHGVKAHAPMSGLLAFCGVTGQSLLYLGEASAEKGPPFLDGGGAHLEVPPQRGHSAGALGQTAASGAFCQRALALLGGGSLKRGQHRQELRGAVQVARTPGGHL